MTSMAISCLCLRQDTGSFGGVGTSLLLKGLWIGIFDWWVNLFPQVVFAL